ncbi:MAG TPA: hypothetical protein VGC41_29785 [Kofleriaceae bacterium]
MTGPVHRDEFRRLEGVWSGTEIVGTSGAHTEATARLTFQTLFDGRFLLCDYVQTLPDKTTSLGHGVFRREDHSGELCVTWFRVPSASATQQATGVAEGDRMIFVETIDGRKTRTTYSMVIDKLTILTEASLRGAEWERVFEGSYRRR